MTLVNTTPIRQDPLAACRVAFRHPVIRDPPQAEHAADLVGGVVVLVDRAEPRRESAAAFPSNRACGLWPRDDGETGDY